MKEECVGVGELAEKLGVSEENVPLLRQALTHKSAVSQGQDDNERLEFLGDSILGMIINEYLYHQYPQRSEGDLTRAKASVVSEPALAEAALKLGIGKYLRMSRGEEGSGGRCRPSMLSDAYEAVLAAVYMDGGLSAARKFVMESLEEPLKAVEHGGNNLDHKSALQEVLQEWHRVAPNYITISEAGPDHEKTFVAEARLGSVVLGTGAGRSKKEAEQVAAKEALDHLLANGSLHPQGENGSSAKCKSEDVPGVSWRPSARQTCEEQEESEEHQ